MAFGLCEFQRRLRQMRRPARRPELECRGLKQGSGRGEATDARTDYRDGQLVFRH